jgi:hypothetical protein
LYPPLILRSTAALQSDPRYRIGSQSRQGGMSLNDLGGAPVAGEWKTYEVPPASLGASGRRITQGFNLPAAK